MLFDVVDVVSDVFFGTLVVGMGGCKVEYCLCFFGRGRGRGFVEKR